MESIPFEPEAIKINILEETDATELEAQKITDLTVRKIISISKEINVLTSPLIRELVCSSMLCLGYELYRFQYTRLGIPYFDYDKRLRSKGITKEEISKQIGKEYKEVTKLINSLKSLNS